VNASRKSNTEYCIVYSSVPDNACQLCLGSQTQLNQISMNVDTV